MDIESFSPTIFAYVTLVAYGAILFLIRKRKFRFWQTALLLLLPILALVLFAVVRYLVLESRLDPFKAHISEYTAVTEYQEGETYIRGKIIPVNIRDNAIDFILYYELPKDLRAASPEEVRTVIEQVCTASSVGTYTRGGGAYRWTCKLKVIDLSISKILEEKTFTGSEPPRTTSGSKSQYGSKPSAEIMAYLTALPRK